MTNAGSYAGQQLLRGQRWLMWEAAVVMRPD